MSRYSIALGKKNPKRPKSKKRFRGGTFHSKSKQKSKHIKIVDSLCRNCDQLQSKYVGDGFDEFYEWKCQAANFELIGHEEPFDHCQTPSWCPKK